ncbi:hypothetical protein Barb4_04767 [Bacteroidales bacterium Barb4]|nr:hypothetical protein Barb4_04767 [Bacteroidales bacterium Barb4]
MLVLTPHSATRRAASLYVGLKSLALSGHLRNIGYLLCGSLTGVESGRFDASALKRKAAKQRCALKYHSFAALFQQEAYGYGFILYAGREDGVFCEVQGAFGQSPFVP